jgi:hypothetical protein
MWLSAATLIIVSLIGLLGQRRAAALTQQIGEVHVLVNQRMTDALKKIDEMAAYIDRTAKPGDPTPPEALP